MKLCPRCSESFADDAGFCPFDGAELLRNSDPLVGRTLAARYRLVRPLGSGGMALVYLAKHVMIDRLSAIKVLRRDLAMSASHRERFLREARAVNRINHPNIVEITDFGESDGLVFLVMEYVEGESLARVAAPRTLRVAARGARGVADRLGARASARARSHPPRPQAGERACHEPGRGGLRQAHRLRHRQDPRRAGAHLQRAALRHAGYIAPEYAEGAPAAPLGDLYALGVVLYEMLTGAMPFDGRGAELLAAPLREAPVKPSARAEGIPAEVEELVLRLIARDPAERPRDAFAVVDALGRPAAPPGRIGAPTGRFRTRTTAGHRWRPTSRVRRSCRRGRSSPRRSRRCPPRRSRRAGTACSAS